MTIKIINKILRKSCKNKMKSLKLLDNSLINPDSFQLDPSSRTNDTSAIHNLISHNYSKSDLPTAMRTSDTRNDKENSYNVSTQPADYGINLHKISSVIKSNKLTRNDYSIKFPETTMVSSTERYQEGVMNSHYIPDATLGYPSRMSMKKNSFVSQTNRKSNNKSMIVYSDVSPMKQIGNQEVLLPEIGLSKYRDQSMLEEVMNPFKIENNTQKLLIMREREREKRRLEILKKKFLQDTSSLNISRDYLESMTTLTTVNKNYMLNKRDRSGALRVINGIQSRNESTLRSASENKTAKRLL